MKTEFLKTLGLEKETIDKIMAENGSDIEREKLKNAPLQEKVGAYEEKLAKLGNVNLDQLKSELEGYKQAEITRSESEKKAKEDEVLTGTIMGVIGEKEFVNDYTKQSILNNIKAELAKSENKGKGAKDIFETLTKDKEGIFKNPNAPLAIPPVGEISPTNITAEQFAKMGYSERVKIKTDNPKLYDSLKGE